MCSIFRHANIKITVIKIQAHQETIAFRGFGRVFLSPPYGFRGNESNQGLWSKKLIDEYHGGGVIEAILLANAMTASKWFQPLWEFTLCFTNHQIRFYRPDGTIGNQPTHASVFVYLGQNREKFAQVFSQFGCIVEKRW